MSSSHKSARVSSASSPSVQKTYTLEEKAKLKTDVREANKKIVDRIIKLRFKIEDIENDIKELETLNLGSYAESHYAKIEKIKARLLTLDKTKTDLQSLSKTIKNMVGGKTTKKRRSNITRKRIS